MYIIIIIFVWNGHASSLTFESIVQGCMIPHVWALAPMPLFIESLGTMKIMNDSGRCQRFHLVSCINMRPNLDGK